MALTKATYSMIEGAPINIVDYGASPSASASTNAVAIQAAADAAKASGGYLIGAPGTYTVDATIQFECNGNLGDVTIEANASSVSPIVRFGTDTGSATSYKLMVLPRVRNNSRTSGVWGSGTAIELANCNTCEITVPSATECEIGLACGGYTSGFAYNTVNLGYIYSNKVNLDVSSLGGASGWSNQNVFIGGRLGFNSSDFTTSGYVGTRDIVLGNADSQANNNLFLNTSVESSLVEYSVEFRQKAAYNILQNLRYEGTAAKKILFNTDTSAGINSNLIIGGYQSDQLVITTSGAGSADYNSVINGRQNSVSASGAAYNLVTGSGSQPHLQGFNAGTQVIGKSSSSTDWRYRLYDSSFSGKIQTSTYPHLNIYWTGSRPYLEFGDGSAAPAVKWMCGYGSPEGVITSSVGGMYTRTDGGAGTTLYIKESGTGNTGWVAK